MFLDTGGSADFVFACTMKPFLSAVMKLLRLKDCSNKIAQTKRPATQPAFQFAHAATRDR
jgi:hypothetical protein